MSKTLIWGWNVRSIVNLELLMWEINFEDECLIPELKLSQQGNITMGYRKGMKFNLMSAKDGDQCLIQRLTTIVWTSDLV